MWVGVAILAIVTAQRLAELWLSARNTRRLLAAGAEEFGRGHYALIVGLHAFWLATLWVMAPGEAVAPAPLFLFALLQLARVWVIASLGQRWTTRIIVLPGAPLVRRGPYRYFRHPNYLIVILEIALLPLAFGLWQFAAIFTVLNAIILAIRIRCEMRALQRGHAC